MLRQCLEQNQHVFVYEDNFWTVQGRYEAAIEEDEDINWAVLDHDFTLKLLVVSFRFFYMKDGLKVSIF
jgi:hypothetical protein